MQTKIMSIFTRTPLHVGAGNSVGAIDSPVMRERHTRIPIIPGSSLKGVLRDLFNGCDEQEKLFGKSDGAGKLLVGEARVLAFPVRSAKGSFAWITCPLALTRYKRDGGVMTGQDKIDLKEMQCYAGSEVCLGNNVILEEYQFDNIEENKTLAEKLMALSDDAVWQKVAGRLVVVTDEMFSYFVEHACEVVTRVRIDDETGTAAAGALFNQEQVPSETMFYAAFAEADGDSLSTLESKLAQSENLIQVGGDATTGLGFCTVKLI